MRPTLKKCTKEKYRFGQFFTELDMLVIVGAGYENQTRTSCLGSKRTITILIPHK